MRETRLWDAPVESIAKGYVRDELNECLVCLVCGETRSEGEVYPTQGRYLTAEKSMRTHIAEAHGGMMEVLLGMNKKYTGLSESQAKVMRLMHQGLSDEEISKELMLSRSTVRNYRFKFREKEKQVKVFSAMMALLVSGSDPVDMVHLGATMIDDRYDISREERDKILGRYFDADGRLTEFPAKQKRKIIVLSALAENFKSGREYSEKEINRILGRIYSDHVTLRRYLIEYGFMDRSNDGSAYWIKD